MPRLESEYSLNFYGGEPLLNFEVVRGAVDFAAAIARQTGKRARFSLSTNGSMLTRKRLEFLNAHRFALEIGFDVTAQETNRMRGSYRRVMANIEGLRDYPGLSVEVNSVFTPETVGDICDSARCVLEAGVDTVRVSLCAGRIWREDTLRKLETAMTDLRQLALCSVSGTGEPRIVNFAGGLRRGIFHCAAGRDRFAIAPDGGIWGCFMFPGYFRGKEGTSDYSKYFFGKLGERRTSGKGIDPRVRARYARLSMDNFNTARGACLVCPDLESCAVCPVTASLSGSPLGMIPPDICEIQRIQIRQRRLYADEMTRTR